MTNKTAKKLKKPLETTLGRAPSSHNNELDLSHLRLPIETSVFGLRQVLHLFETATDEVKNYLMYECDIMYECRTCRTIFRSIANFVLHKRSFCKEKFNSVDYINNNNSVAQECVETIILKEPPAPKPPEDKSEPVKKTLNPIIDKLIEKQKVVQLAQRALSEDLSKISTGNKNSTEEECGKIRQTRDTKVILEQIETSNAAVFQTMLKNLPAQNEQECMKNEVMEIHGILNSDEAILGPDGKISLFETNRARRNSFYMRNTLFCTECKMTFITKKTLEYHIRTKHNNTRIIYHCPSCKLPLATPWSVCRHLLKVHKMSNKQVRRMREQIHNSQVRKDQEPAVKKKFNEAARLQDNTDEENQWLNNFEGDNDFQMCGGCGKRFERKAALYSHSQMCAKRIAVCNAIKENNAKKKEEELAEKAKAAKSGKHSLNALLIGSQKRKPQFCKLYERKPDGVASGTPKKDKDGTAKNSTDSSSTSVAQDVTGNNTAESTNTNVAANIETVFLPASKGTDSPSSFFKSEQNDPLGFKEPENTEMASRLESNIHKANTNSETEKDKIKEDLVNNDIDFDTFCENFGGTAKQNTIVPVSCKTLSNPKKKVNKTVQNTKYAAERCLRRLRSRDVIVDDDDIIFVGEEIQQKSLNQQCTSTDLKSDLLNKIDIVPNNNTKEKNNKTYQELDDDTDFVGFSSEEQNCGRATKINGLCHLGVELDQDLSTLSYNNPLKRKREGLLNCRRTSGEDKVTSNSKKPSPRLSPIPEGSVGTKKSQACEVKQYISVPCSSKTKPQNIPKMLLNGDYAAKSDESQTSKHLSTSNLFKDDEDLEVTFSSFQSGTRSDSLIPKKATLRRRRGLSIDHRSVKNVDTNSSNKWGESFISKATQYMDQNKLLCIPCNISYDSLSLLLWHMSAHFSWFRFQCSRCSFVSFNKYDCVTHAKETHNLKSGDSNCDVDVFLPIPHWKTVLMAHDFQPLVDSDGLSGKHTDEIIVEQNCEEVYVGLDKVRRKSDIVEGGVLLFSELSKNDECSNSSASNSTVSSRGKRCRKTDKIDIDENSSDMQKIEKVDEVDVLMTMNLSDIIKRAVNDEKYRDTLNLDEEDCQSKCSSYVVGDIRSSIDDLSDREFYENDEEFLDNETEKDESFRSVEYNMVVEMVDYSNDKTYESDQQEDVQFLKHLGDNRAEVEQRIERVAEETKVSFEGNAAGEDDAGNCSIVPPEFLEGDGITIKKEEPSDSEDNNVVFDQEEVKSIDNLSEKEVVSNEKEDDNDGCEKIMIIDETINIISSDDEIQIEDDGKRVPKSVPVRMRPARNRIATLQKDFYYDLGRPVKLHDTTGSAVTTIKSNNLNRKKVISNKNKESSSGLFSSSVGQEIQSYRRTYPAKKK